MIRRLALAAAVAAFALPVPTAHAIYCGELQPVCNVVCDVAHYCPR